MLTPLAWGYIRSPQNLWDFALSKKKEKSCISGGRFKNVSEVIRAGLGLLEEEESKVIALKKAVQEGIDRGIAHYFDPKTHLESHKAKNVRMADYKLTNKAVADLSKIWKKYF